MKYYAIQMVDDLDHGDIIDLKIAPIKDEKGKILRGVVIGNTLEQNKAFLLIGHSNDFKGNPTLGVGIENLLLSTQLLEYRHKIREHFNRDGLKTANLDLYNFDAFEIEAHYENS